MLVSLRDVLTRLDGLVAGELSREEVSSWADRRQQAFDDNLLEFDPETDKELIWRGVSYLQGVDLPGDTLGSYLHCPEDFLDFKNELLEGDSQT